MTKFDSAQIKVGMRFSKPVYFDDGISMFIESGITVKPYHLVAISRWNIPFLLTDGRPLGEDEKFVDKDIVEDVDALEDVQDAEDFIEEMDEIWSKVEEIS